MGVHAVAGPAGRSQLEVAYAPGRTVNRMSGAYRGDCESDA